MPLYSYYCADCDRTKTEIRPMKDHMKFVECDRCHERMQFIIDAPPMGVVKNPAAG